MRFSLSYLLLALSAAAVAAPSPSPAEEVVDIPSPGTPAYECHANCGGVITLSKESKFCDRDDFTKKLKACLNCSKKYDIWKYYSPKVTEAADSCDMDATPKEYSKDQMVTPTSSLDPTATVTSSVTVTADAESGASGKSGLAKGAIAGIVVSSVVGAIAIIAASIFACKRRRRKQQPSPHEMDSRGVKWEAGESKTAERV